MTEIAKKKPAFSGMRGFMLMWIGQFVSLIGTGMTRFALTLWAWELTGSATALALVGFFSFAPSVVMSPIAGALVDRWDRKFAMMISDLAAGLSTIAIFILMATDQLRIEHLYIAGFFSGLFESFQWPAYSAAVSVMLPKDQYTRAHGLMGLSESIPTLIVPVMAGILFTSIGLEGILLFDIFSFCFAIGLLFLVYIPPIEATEEGRDSRSGGFLREASYGFRYIFKRPSLLGLQMVFFGINLTGTFTFILLAPMILSRTNNNEVLLGIVQTCMGVGGIMGGLWLSTWGGPKRRVYGVLFGMMGSAVLGQIIFGLGQTPLVWMVGAFFILFFMPLLNGSNQAIWQSKVAPDVQGRVFSVRRLIAQITTPIAMLIAGPLADKVFEPAMTPDGAWADTFGWLVGTGPGAGMALIMIFAGLLGLVVCMIGYSMPFIRNVETLLPDHQAAPISDKELFET